MHNKPRKHFFIKTNKQLIFLVAWLWVLIVLLKILDVSTAIAATPAPIDEVINRLQQAYEKTQDFKAGFSQTTTIRSTKKTDIEEGTIYFKNPKNMLWNYSKPKAKKLIINSRKAWLYLPQEKVAYVQEADYIFTSHTLIKFLSGLVKLKDDFSIKYAEPNALNKQGDYLLILTPLEKTPSLYPFLITVDKNSSLILQVSFEDTMGNSIVVKFYNIATNTGLTGKMFQFKHPKGISIFNMP
jgi:outer membrane lipoprotein carrier protein